jgi:hypothetical protein
LITVFAPCFWVAAVLAVHRFWLFLGGAAVYRFCISRAGRHRFCSCFWVAQRFTADKGPSTGFRSDAARSQVFQQLLITDAVTPN